MISAGSSAAILPAPFVAKATLPLRRQATAIGIRLLPPHDPYLLLRDRETLLPDETLQRQIWRHTGNPGVVLVDGKLAGTWRPQKKGILLFVSVHNGFLNTLLQVQMNHRE